MGDTISHIAPCVVMVIRVFRLLNDPNNLNFQKDFHDLTTPRNCEKRLHKELQLRLRNCPVELPTSCTILGEFTFDHWSSLERYNKIPIAVHLLKGYDKEGGVQLQCIRAPSLKTISSFHPTPICHLLMISPKHVCYIADIKSYK